MAIQKDKPAPSPTEIKNTPHSFNEQELDQLKNLREKLSNLAFQFGQLQINKIKLEETETELKKERLETSNNKSATAYNIFNNR